MSDDFESHFETTRYRRLRDRPTGDLLVLMIAGTVCFVVLGSGFTALVIEVINPDVDTAPIIRQVSDIVSTLIGLLAGFLAGRTDANASERVRQALEKERREKGANLDGTP